MSIRRSALFAALALGATGHAFAQALDETPTSPSSLQFPYLAPADAPRFSAPPGRVAMNNHYEGDGFHVLSEYYNESQGFRVATSGVVMHAVVYQFCANWHGMRKQVPVRFEELKKFCGMRMLFDSETRAQLRQLPPDHVTQFDLVLPELMARIGEDVGNGRPIRFTHGCTTGRTR